MPFMYWQAASGVAWQVSWAAAKDDWVRQNTLLSEHVMEPHVHGT